MTGRPSNSHIRIRTAYKRIKSIMATVSHNLRTNDRCMIVCRCWLSPGGGALPPAILRKSNLTESRNEVYPPRLQTQTGLWPCASRTAMNLAICVDLPAPSIPLNAKSIAYIRPHFQVIGTYTTFGPGVAASETWCLPGLNVSHFFSSALLLLPLKVASGFFGHCGF